MREKSQKKFGILADIPKLQPIHRFALFKCIVLKQTNKLNIPVVFLERFPILQLFLCFGVLIFTPSTVI